MLVTLGTTLPAGAAAQRRVVFGILVDGPSEFTAPFNDLLRQEITERLGAGFSASFPRDKMLEGDWTRPGVDRALQRLLADDEVDVVLAEGVIGTRQAASRGSLSKPVVAAAVVDPELAGLPLAHGSSGVHNLTYAGISTMTRRDVASLRELVPFEHLAVLVNGAYLDAVPGMRQRILDRLSALGIHGTVVPVNTSLSLALAVVPRGADAAVAGFLPRTSAADIDRLRRALINRGLPVFTTMGASWVGRGFLASTVSERLGRRTARRLARDVQHILQGAKASAIPVRLRRQTRLTINMATAGELGISPPWSILTEAVLLDSDSQKVTRRTNLGSAVREAVARNLDLAASGFAVAAGGQQVRRSRSPLLPQVDIGLGASITDADRAQAGLGGRPQRSVTGTVTATQLLYSEAAQARLSVERHRQEARVQSQDGLRLDIILQAATTYLNVLRARAVAAVVRHDLRVSRSNMDLAELRQALGLAAAGETERWESRIARGRRTVLIADSRRSIREVEFNRLVHHPLEEPFLTEEETPEDVDVIVGDPRLAPFMTNPTGFRTFRDFMAREALAGSPELRRLDASIAAQRRSLTAARRAFFLPDLALFGSVSDLLAQGGAGVTPPPIAGIVQDDVSWVAGIQLSYPLFTGLDRGAAKSQADLALDDLTTQRLALTERVQQRVRTAMHRMGASYAGAALAHTAAAAARRNLALVTESYGHGSASITDLIQAQEHTVSADLDAVDAAYDFLNDSMEVERAVGGFSFFMTRAERNTLVERLEEFAAGGAG